MIILHSLCALQKKLDLANLVYIQVNGNKWSIVYTGFKPAWFILKVKSGGLMLGLYFESKRRDIDNPVTKLLILMAMLQETQQLKYIFLSNGFKIKRSSITI